MESVYFRATKGYEPICQFYVDLLKKQLQENPIEPYGSSIHLFAQSFFSLTQANDYSIASVQIDNVKELVDVTAYKVTDFFATQVSPEISELYEYDKRPVENVTINPQRHAFDFCFSWVVLIEPYIALQIDMQFLLC